MVDLEGGMLETTLCHEVMGGERFILLLENISPSSIRVIKTSLPLSFLYGCHQRKLPHKGV